MIPRMRRGLPPPIHLVAPLVFGTGLCALIYQLVWMRQLRSIFGGSTAASAAVLAVFIGGLGLGALRLGKRADPHPRPLLFYAWLEAMVAVFAAATPLLVWLARGVYLGIGGTVVLGDLVGTVLRVILTVVAIGVPAFLMGGTLPAAVRAVVTTQDVSRSRVGLLYGVNTLGAVCGCLLATFWLLEALGTRTTLWLTCGINLAVAITAYAIGRTGGQRSDDPPTPREATSDEAPTSRPFVMAAAGIVGFVFFLMEIVWYRMLAPLLGGSVYTLGLILAVVLLGIGIGGVLYSRAAEDRPATVLGFALLCLLQAASIAAPFALGDSIAFLAVTLRDLSGFGFAGLVMGWAVVTAIVVLPGAMVAGAQFPQLIALLGRGRRDVGRHVSLAYAANTVGAILGSLAGGFGLLPALSATGCWLVSVFLLVTLGVAALGLAARQGSSLTGLAIPGAVALAALAMLLTQGPTHAWRHSPVGAGRVTLPANPSRNDLRAWLESKRRGIVWQADGVESAVALQAVNGLAFLINGKSDGNSIIDAPTQVMSGLVGAMLHPNPKRAMVIGLGTGSTAGWLGKIPAMERVDVVELEPVILHVAKEMAPVNQSVLDNSKVNIIFGDAREVLQTTDERYQLIFSEPSNPYRAGISSLFTREYYQAIAERLTGDGLFAQWVPAYEIDSQTIRTVYATLRSVFPTVETWDLLPNDILLMASNQAVVFDVPRLRQRVDAEPYRTALLQAWRCQGLECFFAHYVGRPSLADHLTTPEARLNTDDRNLVEFGYARRVGRKGSQGPPLRRTAVDMGIDRPQVKGGVVDWQRVVDERVAMLTTAGKRTKARGASTERRARARAQALHISGDLLGARRAWASQSRAPRGPIELGVVAEAMAETGDPNAMAHIEALMPLQMTEALVIRARLSFRQGKVRETADDLESAFARYREDPWPSQTLMRRAMSLSYELAKRDQNIAARMLAAVEKPFVLHSLNESRSTLVINLAKLVDFKDTCVQAFAPLEPHVPWIENVLSLRWKCYKANEHDAAERAAADLAEFRSYAPPPGFASKTSKP